MYNIVSNIYYARDIFKNNDGLILIIAIVSNHHIYLLSIRSYCYMVTDRPFLKCVFFII